MTSFADSAITVCRTVVRATRLVNGTPRFLNPWTDQHQTNRDVYVGTHPTCKLRYFYP